MKRDIAIYPDDMLESIKLIVLYLDNSSEDDFNRTTQLHDAILHRIQIIGEAAKQVPEEYRDRWSQIPWRDIAGMRDIIVHEYSGITLAMIWKLAVEDIPVLKSQITSILKEIQKSDS